MAGCARGMAACLSARDATPARPTRRAPGHRRAFQPRMISGRLSRARRMTLKEGTWRTVEMARTAGDRLRARFETPRWRRQDIADVLASPVLTRTMRSAIARHEWGAVNEALFEHLSQRQSRCVIDPSLADAVRQQVLARWPAAAADASMRADRILGGDYDLLGYRGLRFSPSSPEP